ncbi:GM10521 [Drosophila sechellia]|uniref:GM10521 n=1 Tax=Drosophila sechellia TaxID=7238 RepID=B4IEL9_DROSE|nr:GM10521 [Drosophila sechellia]
MAQGGAADAKILNAVNGPNFRTPESGQNESGTLKMKVGGAYMDVNACLDAPPVDVDVLPLLTGGFLL